MVASGQAGLLVAGVLATIPYYYTATVDSSFAAGELLCHPFVEGKSRWHAFMRKALIYIPIVLSLVVLGAHFMRYGNSVGVIGSALLFQLSILRRHYRMTTNA